MLNRALKLLRTYHQLKQTELAKLLGIVPSFVSQIELGQKKAGFDVLERYAKVFKMPVSSILLFSEKISDRPKTGEKIRVIAANKILKLLEWIDEAENDKVKE